MTHTPTRPVLSMALRAGGVLCLGLGLGFGVSTVAKAQSSAQTSMPTVQVAAVKVAAVKVAALAETGAPRLLTDVTVYDRVVRLGDLITNAGLAADSPVFLAPEPGLAGRIDAGPVRAAAAKAGLALPAEGAREILVRRYGTAATAAEIEMRLRDELASAMSEGGPEIDPREIELRFSQPPLTLSVPDRARLSFGKVHLWGPEFEVEVSLGRQTQMLTGRADVSVPALALTRPVQRGEVLTADDLAFVTVSRPSRGATVAALEEAIGFALDRSLRAGDTILASDLMRPVVMERGAPVTLVHRTGRMILSVRATALANARVGDVIDVLNTHSRRTVQARVTGAEEAEAVGAHAALPTTTAGLR